MIKKYNIRCHSGGAIGADTYFENISSQYNIQTIAYSYQTVYTQNINENGIKAIENLLQNSFE